MTEEIKEILDKLKDCVNNPIDIEVDQFTQETYHIPNYFCLNATTNDCKSLLNYITDLQQENELLKLNNPEMNIEHFRIVKENKRKIDILRKQNKDYKSRNEKAIEYIKSKKAIINTDYIRIFDLFKIEEQGYTNDLLNILEGGDE